MKIQSLLLYIFFVSFISSFGQPYADRFEIEVAAVYNPGPLAL
jgi:hypothetical protein